MNKLSSLAPNINRKPLRIAIWHVDGYALTASQFAASSSSIKNKTNYRDSHQRNNNAFTHDCKLHPKMTFDERKPLISKFLSSVAEKVDAFVVIGADKNTVSDPSEICDIENQYDCVVSACNNNTSNDANIASINSSVFVFVPKKEANDSTGKQLRRNNFSSAWKVETLPGACGQHLKFTYVGENDDNKMMTDEDQDHPSEIRSSFDQVVRNEKLKSERGNHSEHDESLQKETEKKKNKQSIFVNCCFLDLSGTSRNSANTASKNMNNSNKNITPAVFPLDSNLGIASSFEAELLKKKQQIKRSNSTSSSSDLNENEKRLNDYFSNVATSTDLIAGHLRHFRVGVVPDAVLSKYEAKGKKKIAPVAIWKDAFVLTGKRPESKITFDPELNLESYYHLEDRNDKKPTNSRSSNDRMKVFSKAVGPARRSDRFLLRDSSDIFCKELLTVKSPFHPQQSMLLASCNLPVIAEFNVPPRWVF